MEGGENVKALCFFLPAFSFVTMHATKAESALKDKVLDTYALLIS